MVARNGLKMEYSVIDTDNCPSAIGISPIGLWKGLETLENMFPNEYEFIDCAWGYMKELSFTSMLDGESYETICELHKLYAEYICSLFYFITTMEQDIRESATFVIDDDDTIKLITNKYTFHCDESLKVIAIK